MIVAMDTSGTFPVVAAVGPAGMVYGSRARLERAHAEELAPMVRVAVAQGRPSAVAVGRGPGGFTGLRVGLVTAQTLGWALEIPVVGFCSLDVVADQEGLIDGWVVLDARRNEMFLAGYAEGRRVSGPTVASRAEAAALVSGRNVCGDVALLTSTQRRDRGTTVLQPSALAHVALAAVAADPPEPPQPHYLRRPDVTMSAANSGGTP